MERRTLEQMAADSNGLKCPKCGCAMVDVQRRVAVADGFRRIRTCRNCGQRLQTSEHLDRLIAPVNHR